jgi:hypothetical protein
MTLSECVDCGREIPLPTDEHPGVCCDCHDLRLAARAKQREEQQANVDHPSHYGGDTTYEAIKVIEAWGLGFHLGNAVKYIARAGKKPGAEELEDLKKSQWYLDRQIRLLESRLFGFECGCSLNVRL